MVAKSARMTSSSADRQHFAADFENRLNKNAPWDNQGALHWSAGVSVNVKFGDRANGRHDVLRRVHGHDHHDDDRRGDDGHAIAAASVQWSAETSHTATGASHKVEKVPPR